MDYYYVTSTRAYSTAIDDAHPANSTTSISTQGYIVELGEYLYDGDLRMYDETRDDFGRPATRWTYRTNEIGTYAEEPIATYTAKVERGTLYSLIGRSNVNDLVVNGTGDSNVLSAYINGADAGITVSDLFRSNSSSAVMDSGKGVVTEVYQDSDGYYEGDLFTQGVGSSGRRAGAMSIASGHQIDYSAGTLDLGSAVYTVNNNTQIVLVLKDASNASATGTKDRTNNLGARTTDGGVIVMRDDNAKHEVYTVSGQTLENYVRDRNVDGEFYGITSDNDSDLLEVLYVVIEDVSLLSGESRVSGT